MAINVLIFEDNQNLRFSIETMLEWNADFNLLKAMPDANTVEETLKNYQPDVILMDIRLIDGTAFDIINGLNQTPENIIFITAYNQFAIKAIKFGALDYLLKPISEVELSEALQRYRNKRDKETHWSEKLNIAQQSLNDENLPQSIVLHTISQTHIVMVQDIVYCKGDGPYTFFYLENGKNLLVSKPLKHYEEILSAPWFLRTHQSYLVNKNFVDTISKSEYLVLKNKEEIPVSSRRKNYILNALSSL